MKLNLESLMRIDYQTASDITWICLAIGGASAILDACLHRFPRGVDMTSRVDSSGRSRLDARVAGQLRAQRFDDVAGVLPFVWIYCHIIILASLFLALDLLIIKIVCVFLIGCRLRAAQEASHFALHGSLCKTFSWGLTIADVFYQCPMLLQSASQRYATHVVSHHPNVNDPHKDPNVMEFIALGFKPPISVPRFLLLITYPMTPSAIVRRLRSGLASLRADPGLRTAQVLTIWASIAVVGGPWACLWLYFVPVMVVHPWLAWISQLVEHRWFLRATPRWQHEYSSGRSLELSGPIGELARVLVLPFGDSFHLAHSLYPGVRWNYLRRLDGVLREQDANYYAMRTSGLLVSRSKSAKSAFRELFETFVTPIAAGAAVGQTHLPHEPS